MENTDTKRKRQKRNPFIPWRRILPELILLLLCTVWLLSGIHQKKGYHMDELLSFELANAEFNPWIVPNQPQGRLAKFVENEIDGESFAETFGNVMDTVKDVMENRGSSKLLTYSADVYTEPVWIDRQQFTDYITVDANDAFNYLSVYFNVKDDNHPPLHFMVLHTVSSVFQGQLTPLMGCGINLVCVLGMMLLLMWLGRRFMMLFGKKDQGRAAGLWAAGLYGLSAGALSTTLLIRMYAMMSFFCVALLAIHLNKLYAYRFGAKDFSRKNKLLILVTVLGFWTQYFFLFYCLILAAVTVLLLLREDRGVEAGQYIRSMVTAAVIGLAGFPFAVSHVFSSGRGVDALESLASGLTGYWSRLAAFAGICRQEFGLVAVILTGLVIVVGMVMRIFQGQGIICRGLVALLVVPVAGYFLLAARMSPYLVDRYIMPVFPLGILMLVLGACCFANRIITWGLVTATLLAQPFQTLAYDSPYLYSDYPEQLMISEEYAEYPCICISEGVGYYENLLEFENYARTLILTTQELAGREDQESVAAAPKLVVILKEEVDKAKVCRIFREQYSLYPEEILMPRGGVYEDEILLFGLMEKMDE